MLQTLVDVGIDGWKSRYASVDTVLRHLQRKSGGYGAPSYASVEWYGVVLNSFCKYVGKDPDQLVSLGKHELEDLIHSYLDVRLAKGLSKKIVKNRRTCLLMHFKKNGYRGEKELEIESYPVPARYRKMLEYIRSSAEVLAMADAARSFLLGIGKNALVAALVEGLSAIHPALGAPPPPKRIPSTATAWRT